MGKKVWGYKLSFIKNGGGKKEFVRYTPTKMDLYGLKIWYEVGSDDNGKYINITHAASGIKIKELRNCKVTEIAKKITQEECDNIANKVATEGKEEDSLLHQAMYKQEKIQLYIAEQCDSVKDFSSGKDGNYPPEQIPWEFALERELGRMVLKI